MAMIGGLGSRPLPSSSPSSGNVTEKNRETGLDINLAPRPEKGSLIAGWLRLAAVKYLVMFRV